MLECAWVTLAMRHGHFSNSSLPDLQRCYGPPPACLCFLPGDIITILCIAVTIACFTRINHLQLVLNARGEKTTTTTKKKSVCLFIIFKSIFIWDLSATKVSASFVYSVYWRHQNKGAGAPPFLRTLLTTSNTFPVSFLVEVYFLCQLLRDTCFPRAGAYDLSRSLHT